MITRFIAVLVLVASVAYLAMGLMGLFKAADMASFLALAARAYDTPFDQADWLRHWRTGSALALVAGLFGFASSLGMFWRRLWAFALLASLTTLFFAIYLVSYSLGPSAYAFEVVEPLEVLLLAVLSLASWFLFARIRRTSIRNRAA